MTDYGQGIPPRWYRDVTAKQVTKMNFAHLLHRAFMQVGMIPIRSWNPFDLELPANAEYVTGSSNSNLIWYYDYPTSETFDVDGVAYRPVLVMVVMIRDDSTALSSAEASAWFRLEHGIRRADRLVRDDFLNVRRMHATVSVTNFGHELYTDTVGVSVDMSVYEANGLGAVFGFSAWMAHAASTSTTRNQRLGVNNIHVVLGKGGLLVQVGSGTGKTDRGDILSLLIAFGGARIPGRAKIPANDGNLNRINPTFALPLRHTTLTNYYSTSVVYEDVTLTGVRPASLALGCQHDLKIARSTATGMTARPGAVSLQIFNLENIERPFWPSVRADTVNSPREHPSGAAHILQPLVYTQDLGKGSTEYYQVQDFNVRSQVAPTWFDIWMCPKVRFGDRTAPAGEYVDPVSNLNWWLFYASNINTMMAVEVEGVTKFSTLGYFDTFNIADDDHFNLNGGFTWVSPTPHGASASQTVGTSMSQAWTPTPATDEATAVHLASGGASTLTFVLDLYGGVPADSSYSLQLELRWYSVSAQVDSTSNSLNIEYSHDNGTSWTTLQTIYNTGVSAIPFNDWTATAELPILPGSTDGRIRFRIRTAFGSATGGNRTAAIRNIHVRRYVRAP